MQDISVSSSSRSLNIRISFDSNIHNEANMFVPEMRSARGRRVKPSTRMNEFIKETEGKSIVHENASDQNGGKGLSSRGFMEQFTPEERKMIEITEKLGDKEQKDADYFEQKKAPTKRLKRLQTCERKTSTISQGTVKGRLAKKLKIKL